MDSIGRQTVFSREGLEGTTIKTGETALGSWSCPASDVKYDKLSDLRWWIILSK